MYSEPGCISGGTKPRVFLGGSVEETGHIERMPKIRKLWLVENDRHRVITDGDIRCRLKKKSARKTTIIWSAAFQGLFLPLTHQEPRGKGQVFRLIFMPTEILFPQQNLFPSIVNEFD